MKYHVSIGPRTFEVEVGRDGIRVDGRAVSARLERVDGTPVRSLVVGCETHRLLATRNGKGDWKLRLGGWPLEVSVVDERTRAIREMTGAGAATAGPRPVVAPMPGMVVKVEVEEGDLVESGQGIVIVEAMKMENELRASGPGRVVRIHVREGEAVEKDEVLVDLGPAGDEGDA